ncbi:MAG: TraR/DksA C4-type zinc finger protein [Kiritimatiellia bacterium]
MPAVKVAVKGAAPKPNPPPSPAKPVAKPLQVGALTGRAALKALTNRSSSDSLDNSKHFTPKELESFRLLLLNTRDRMVDEISFLVGDNLNRSARDAAGDLSHYSIHMADQGTDNFDREFALNLASGEQDLLYEIDEALARVQNKTYGMCEMTGLPIEKERLKAIPYARYCIAAQSEIERGKTKYRPFGPSMSLGG